MPAIPTDKKLYKKVKSQAKLKFQVWPSAYASAWLVKTYKKLGGEYSTSKLRFSAKKTKSKTSGLSRWFSEEWIDVCQLPKIVSCGRNKKSQTSSRQYPYCRPLHKISSKTPSLAKSLSSYDIKKRCSQKKRSPFKKVFKTS